MRLQRAVPATGALAVGLVALALAACGGDDGGGADNATASSGSNAPVSVQSIDGSDVLVDSGGRVLYMSEQEKGGKIMCTEGCTAIWEPATASSLDGVSSDVKADLGHVKRPDGARQLTFQGDPLYSFTEEGAGELTGDGLTDAFSGTTFKWHAASVGGSEPSDSGSSTPSSPY